VEVPKSETQMSPDLRGEADRIDDLAHALADDFRRKVFVVGIDDKELVVEPRGERRLGQLEDAAMDQFHLSERFNVCRQSNRSCPGCFAAWLLVMRCVINLPVKFSKRGRHSYRVLALSG